MTPELGGVTARVDGRRARGDRRRTAIIAATLAVVEREGVAGVTHRTVAREASVSASSALYYFATLDDLLVAALSAAAVEYDDQFAALRRGGASPLDAVAELIADCGAAGRQRALAERELTLLAARRPPLRPLAQRWPDLVAAAAREHTDDPVAVANVVAAADGMCTRVLLEPSVTPTAEVRAVLHHALRG